ncbi:hypothetical protein F444_15485 [Phytophthora nicotianae P1976]|uniref:Uncharacterized protein n=1 Tax=Phytophthora nicotianae P1976 TaxID=1317066 RepID=A0A080ZLV5_PHYNI|nr:hypothetical protein F444_15485 [Phytophthora nicotianae P1976]
MTLSSLNTWDFFSPHANTVLVSMQTAVLAGNQQQNDAIGSLLHDSQLELGLETEAPRQQQQVISPAPLSPLTQVLPKFHVKR